MPILRTMEPPKIVAVIAAFALGLIFFQAIYTSAQGSASAEVSDARVEPAPETILALTAQLKQLSLQISKLEDQMQATERRAKVLQSQYGDLNRQMSLLRSQIHKSSASTADDRKSVLKIEKVTRLVGGKPEPMDMVVSIKKFSTTWKQIDAIMDKLDEITQSLSQP